MGIALPLSEAGAAAARAVLDFQVAAAEHLNTTFLDGDRIAQRHTWYLLCDWRAGVSGWEVGSAWLIGGYPQSRCRKSSASTRLLTLMPNDNAF
jgi:hypothetical protein